MNWKRFIAPVFYSSTIVSVLVLLDHWNRTAHTYDTHHFIVYAILVISLSCGLVGMEELKRGGHMKLRRNLLVCLAAMWVLSCLPIFARNRLHWNLIGSNFPVAYFFIPPYVLLVATLPIAILLNRRESRSSFLATTNNAE
ncbi:MAG: hypothetical protein ABSE46_23295 [Terracidiphilus sp.]|jgi:membrane-associated HD superfamily phosphohydrolase